MQCKLKFVWDLCSNKPRWLSLPRNNRFTLSLLWFVPSRTGRYENVTFSHSSLLLLVLQTLLTSTGCFVMTLWYYGMLWLSKSGRENIKKSMCLGTIGLPIKYNDKGFIRRISKKFCNTFYDNHFKNNRRKKLFVLKYPFDILKHPAKFLCGWSNRSWNKRY